MTFRTIVYTTQTIAGKRQTGTLVLLILNNKKTFATYLDKWIIKYRNYLKYKANKHSYFVIYDQFYFKLGLCESIDSPDTKVMGGYEPHKVGFGKRTKAFYKSSKHSLNWAISTAPVLFHILSFCSELRFPS